MCDSVVKWVCLLPGREKRGRDDHGHVMLAHLVGVAAGHDLTAEAQQVAQRGALLWRQQQDQQVQGAALRRTR